MPDCRGQRQAGDGADVHLDYTGTAAQVALPLNAVYGVTLSGVYYALRTVTGASIPMNEGCFRPVRVEVPANVWLRRNGPTPGVTWAVLWRTGALIVLDEPALLDGGACPPPALGAKPVVPAHPAISAAALAAPSMETK